jgi:flagellar L-ring protein precursor FlgH
MKAISLLLAAPAPLASGPALAGTKKKPDLYAPALPPSPGEGRGDGSIFAANISYTRWFRARGRMGWAISSPSCWPKPPAAPRRPAPTPAQRQRQHHPPAIAGTTIAAAALNASSASSFKGSGNATQTNAFNGTIAVTIAEVRPNGTALVRGKSACC